MNKKKKTFSTHFTDITPPFSVPGPKSFWSNIPRKEDTSRINYIESTGIKCLTPRQACGIESSARQNSYMSVKVYFNTVEMNPPSWDDRIMRPGRVRSCTLNHLLTSHYSNVEMIAANFTNVLQETQFRPLVEFKRLQKIRASAIELGEAMRLFILKKYGGFYLDFDSIVFRPLHCLRNMLSYLTDQFPSIINEVMV